MTGKTPPRRVSVIGLGLMGSALAEALLNAGHEVTVWNRTAAKAEPLTAKGARAAASAAEALAASGVTIVCLTNHAATMEALNGVTAPDGRTLGLRRSLGLLTPKGLAQEATDVPVLRRLLAEVLIAEEALPESHDAQEHIRDVDGTAMNLTMAIRYQDEFQRTAEGWRFSRRRLAVDWERDLPLALAAPGT